MCYDVEDFLTHGVIPPLNHMMYWREGNDVEADGSHALGGLFKALQRPLFHTLSKPLNSMGGQLKRIEPASCDTVKDDEEVWNILLENGITTFLERMAGYSALVSYAIMASWSRGHVQIGNTYFTISTNAITDATGLPATGDIYFKRSLHAEIPDTSLADDILGLAKLYPDSPASEQIETNQPVEDPNSQKFGDILVFTDSKPHADTLKSPSNMDANPAEPVVADSQRDERRVELVSSILNKLQRAFNALKAWEVFTDTTRNAIAKDCSELITLADQLAEDSGSPRARNVVAELKKLI
ncbi:hypothetical protein KI387_043325 [Taxus chinensis]|uniref:Uncharacterized protein n=1 Tax=Taxus chinensis TaxID=29808 RepID=A0AA38C6V4_TAXCH|nr:hypothetical protein KI387_043325 [Taxus chinensis]